MIEVAAQHADALYLLRGAAQDVHHAAQSGQMAMDPLGALRCSMLASRATHHIPAVDAVCCHCPYCSLALMTPGKACSYHTLDAIVHIDEKNNPKLSLLDQPQAHHQSQWL